MDLSISVDIPDLGHISSLYKKKVRDTFIYV